eukprot:5493191-Prymnesium_polylepis.1
MGEAMHSFHTYSRLQTRATPYVSTHFIWPFHAARVGLALRWGLLDGDRALSLARGDMGASHFPGWCLQPSSAPVVLLGQFPESQFPPPMRWQCPHESAILCPCKARANSHGS